MGRWLTILPKQEMRHKARDRLLEQLSPVEGKLLLAQLARWWPLQVAAARARARTSTGRT